MDVTRLVNTHNEDNNQRFVTEQEFLAYQDNIQELMKRIQLDQEDNMSRLGVIADRMETVPTQISDLVESLDNFTADVNKKINKVDQVEKDVDLTLTNTKKVMYITSIGLIAMLTILFFILTNR